MDSFSLPGKGSPRTERAPLFNPCVRGDYCIIVLLLLDGRVHAKSRPASLFTGHVQSGLFNRITQSCDYVTTSNYNIMRV